MTTTFSPLQHYSRLILAALNEAATHENPAWFLYKHKTRSMLFMVEALTRILTNLSENKLVPKGRKKSKRLEDSLGVIEDYDAWHHYYARHKNIKQKERNYFLKKRDKEIKRLNELLVRKDFYREFFTKLMDHEIVHFNDPVLIRKLEACMKAELDHCFRFFMQYADGFTELESQVHEMRRKLRWISMYGKCMDGILVLDTVKTHYAWEKEFVSPGEQKSPYNELPVNHELKAHIHLNKKAFFALNYVVSLLGKIKEKGYHLEELAKVISKCDGVSKEKAMKTAAEKLGLRYTEQDIFDAAHSLLHSFFIKYRIYALLPAD